MRILRSFFYVLLCVWSNILIAQTNGRISGTVLDPRSNKPVEYASVSIAADGKVLNGTVTNKKGEFVLKGLAHGAYIVSVAFVGYDTYTTDTLRINNGSTVTGLEILLEPSSSMLNSVTVSASTPLVQNKIDRVVYNAANDITSQGGAAIDVLRKVPQVTVDIDGNVELQGNPNIRFLINGKPSAVFGNSLTDHWLPYQQHRSKALRPSLLREQSTVHREQVGSSISF